jgi:hypothetical protein
VKQPIAHESPQAKFLRATLNATSLKSLDLLKQDQMPFVGIPTAFRGFHAGRFPVENHIR